MPLDFPSSPSVNDTYSYGGTTWIWDGTAWYVQAPASINNTPIGNITPSTGEFTTLSSTGNTTLSNIEGNLIPAANVTYNLGSNTARWNDIWLANSTIHIGDANISANGSTLLLPSTVYVGDSPLTESGGSLNLPAGTANVEAGGTANVPKISSVQITDSSWNVIEDTAIPLEGGYVVINGSGFESTATVYAGETQPSAVTFVSSSVLRCQFGAKSAGTYNIFVVNPDGGTAIRVNGITWSSFPAWATASALPTQTEDMSVNIQLVSTENPTYTLQEGSSLPSGLTLSSGGLISGTVTGITTDTTYNFTIVAIDAQSQDSPRAFSITFETHPLGTLWTWGDNSSGALGFNNTINRSSPTQVGTDTDWATITVNYTVSMGIKSNGTLWKWGYVTDGATRSSPTQIGSATDWKIIAAGGLGQSAAIKTDGTLWIWGQNGNGQLGLGNAVGPVQSPTQLGSDTWSAIATLRSSTLGIKTNGTLWSWGFNSHGQLGLGNTLERSSPMQVGTDTNWLTVVGASAGSFLSVLAMKNNGTIWSWGCNNYGQLGLGNRVYRSSPVQIGTEYNWSRISMDTSVAAIKTDGTLWTWGLNFSGELGLNDRVYRSSPVQIGSSTDWTEIATGNGVTFALKTNGTLWAAGTGNNGGNGIIPRQNRSTFTQVGAATNWDTISAGQSTGMAIRKV